MQGRRGRWPKQPVAVTVKEQVEQAETAPEIEPVVLAVAIEPTEAVEQIDPEIVAVAIEDMSPLYPEREPVYCYTWDIPNSNCPTYTMHIQVPVASCESVQHAITAALGFQVPIGDTPGDGYRSLNVIERQWVESREPNVERETQNIPLHLEAALADNHLLREQNRGFAHTKRVFEVEGIDPLNPNAWRLGVLGQSQAIVTQNNQQVAEAKQGLYSELQGAIDHLVGVAKATGWAPLEPVVVPPNYEPLTVVSTMPESEFFTRFPELSAAIYIQRKASGPITDTERYGLKMLYGTHPSALSVPHQIRMRANAGDTEITAFEAAVALVQQMIGDGYDE